jgi:hypothetical protein
MERKTISTIMAIPRKSQRTNSIIILFTNQKKNKPSIQNHFNIFRYHNPTFEFEFYLLSNRSVEGAALIPEISSFDYFLLVKHYIDDEDLDALLENIKSIPEVLLVKEIDPTILKSKENLIF